MPRPTQQQIAQWCGWIDLPVRHTVAATLPTIAQAGPNLKPDRTRNVLLYKCFTDVFTRYPDYPAQQIGDCVGFGWSHAHDLLQTIDCYLGGRDVSTIHRTCTEYMYASSRKAGNFLGNQDGSFGSAAARAAVDTGMLPYSEIDADYDGRRAKEWGRTGPPAEHESAARKWRLGNAALLNTADDLLAAISAGKPAAICSAHGFTLRRDENGFCRIKGRWGHCMWVGGFRSAPPGYLILQSWGPNMPTGPTDLDQPSWSFWASEADVARIMAEGDSFALSQSPTFEPQALPAAWHAA